MAWTTNICICSILFFFLNTMQCYEIFRNVNHWIWNMLIYSTHSNRHNERYKFNYAIFLYENWLIFELEHFYFRVEMIRLRFYSQLFNFFFFCCILQWKMRNSRMIQSLLLFDYFIIEFFILFLSSPHFFPIYFQWNFCTSIPISQNSLFRIKICSKEFWTWECGLFFFFFDESLMFRVF